MFKKSEIKLSLKTLSKKKALIGRAKADLEWDEKFDAAQSALESSANCTTPIGLDEAIKRIQDWVEKRSQELGDIKLSSSEALSEVQIQENLADNESRLFDLQKSTEQGIADVSILWRRLFGEALNQLDQTEKNKVFDVLRRAEIEIVQRLIAVDKSDFSKQFFDQIFGPSSPGSHSFTTLNDQGISLEDLATAYLEKYEKESKAQDVSLKRRKDVKSHVALVVEILGADTLAASVNYEIAQEFRDTLNRLPTNRKKRYPALTVSEAIAKAKKENHPIIGRTMQKKYLTALQLILSFGVIRGDLTANKALGLKPLGKKMPAEDAKKPYSVAQLTAIFNAPIYTGCVDDELGFAKKGDKIIRRARFWVPLICLFNGMRPKEVCQLKPKNIKQTATGTWYFDVTDVDDDQTLKTLSSRRKFPVHPDLKRMGFLEYVEARKAESATRLFPELKPDQYTNYATNFCRWFNRSFLPKVTEKLPDQSFYSLRHNFSD